MSESERTYLENLEWLRALSTRLKWTFCDVLLAVAGEPYPTVSPLEMLNTQQLEAKLIEHYRPRFMERLANDRACQLREAYSEETVNSMVTAYARKQGKKGGRPKLGKYDELICEAIAAGCGTKYEAIIQWIYDKHNIVVSLSSISRYFNRN